MLYFKIRDFKMAFTFIEKVSHVYSRVYGEQDDRTLRSYYYLGKS